MFVTKKLRLNRFRAVPIPTPRRMFQLYGLKAPAVVSKQTAEVIDETIPFGVHKTQALSLANDMAAKAVEFIEDPKNTDPLPFVDPKKK